MTIVIPATTPLAVSPWVLELNELRGWKDKIADLEQKFQQQQKLIQELARRLSETDPLHKMVLDFELR